MSLKALSTRGTVGTDSSASTRCSQDFAENDTSDPISRDMLTCGVGSWAEAHGSDRAAAIDGVVGDNHSAERAKTASNERVRKGKADEQSLNAVGAKSCGSNGNQKK